MSKLALLDHVHPLDRASWRAWLEENHATSPGVWLIAFKKETGRPRVEYEEAVEEALCFGWIDSVPGKMDDGKFKQLFTPRKPRSNWAGTNKARVEKLTAAGLMRPAGQRMVDLAKQTGTWDALNEVEQQIEPPDLLAAFDAFEKAKQNWSAFSPSSRRAILDWIRQAKTAETRQKRINETATLAEQNVKANQWVKK